MRTIEYEDIKCGSYEVMATEGGHFSDNCDYFILFRNDKHGGYEPVHTIGTKTLVAPLTLERHSYKSGGSEFIVYGFSVVVGGLRLYLCNPDTHETDTDYLLDSAEYCLLQYHRTQTTSFWTKSIKCDYNVGKTSYNAIIKRCHTGCLGNTDENADEVQVQITEARPGITREFLFSNIVPRGKEKNNPKTVDVVVKTDF